MKLKIILIALLISVSVFGQKLSVMTYNIRYDNPEDGINNWNLRKENLIKQIKFYEPIILGIQEGLSHQVAYIDSSLSNYSYYGVGREDGKNKGEYCAIYYKKKKVELLEAGTFWLSETPEKVSVGWDAALERICTYVKFKDKESGKTFIVYDTHFDHMGKKARYNSAKLIAQKNKELNKENLSVILMGDFNLTPDTKPIKYLSTIFNDSRKVAKEVSFGPKGTYNDFNFEKNVTDRIDYIFTDKKKIKVKKYAILSENIDKKYLSDHFAVYVELKFKKK